MLLITYVMSDGEKSTNPLLSALGFSSTGSLDFETLKQTLEMFKRESSSKLQQVIPRHGYTKLSLNMDYNTRTGINIKTFQSLTMQDMFEDSFNAKNPNVAASLEKALKLIQKDVGDGADKHIMTFQFQNSKGKMVVAIIKVETTTDSKVNLFYGSMEVELEKAKDLLVIQHSKKNFFRSKSWVELVPLDATVTTDEVKYLAAMVLGNIIEWTQKQDLKMIKN